MTWLSIINGVTRLFNGLLDWWREKSIHDAGVNAERLRVMEAERKAHDVAENIKPVTADDVVSRLRKHEF